MEDNLLPYKKKKDSNKSKSSKKSKHKHIWEECFLHSSLPEKYYSWIQDPYLRKTALEVYSPGFRCKICGKCKTNYLSGLNLFAEKYNIAVLKDNLFKEKMEKRLSELCPNWKIYEIPSEDWYKI